MSQIAVLDYFTYAGGTELFVARNGWREPLVLYLRWPDGKPLRLSELETCADRMLIDFHGLPQGWAESGQAQQYRTALALPPAVSALKRAQPILSANLAKPQFAYSMDYWERLSTALVPEKLRPYLEECEMLCIVPHGPLHTLPFAALRWTDGSYLGERFGICYAPSVSVLRHCRRWNRARNDANHRPTSMLVAAVAAAEDPDRETFESEGARLAQAFTGLSGAAVTLLSGSDSREHRPASKREVLNCIQNHDLVHFACHGIFGLDVRGGRALDSGLVLSDGDRAPRLADVPVMSVSERRGWFLTAQEIMSLTMRADLVTLRACSSGRVQTDRGGELFGLLRAFLYAGAPAVVASLWNVHKGSSQLLLDRFYEQWLQTGRRVSRWKAMQAAQLSLLRGEYSHPYHWAAFVVVGDWF